MIKIYVKVIDADGNTNYPLTRDNTEVKIDGNRVNIEDITIQSSSPTFLWYEYVLYVKAPSEPGDHAVWVQVVTDQGSASDSKSFSISKAFTFVHMTDVHIGAKQPWLPWRPFEIRLSPEEKDRRFSAAIDEMNEGIWIGNVYTGKKPDFILITGDTVEYGGNATFYQRFLEHLRSLDSSIKVYIEPGNHDWYGGWFLIPGDLSNYNALIDQYMDRYVNRLPLIPPNNYTFDYGGYLFVGLDSGRDEGYPIVGGSGLEQMQMETFTSLLRKDPTKRVIIFMHHPAVNPGPLEEPKCIQHNRKEFIDNCSKYNVQIALTGHTHADGIFNANGGRVSAYSTIRPLFIQTPSIVYDDNNCPHGYRVISVNSKGVTVYPYTPTRGVQYLRAAVSSPINLHAYDSQERHTGINTTIGEYERNIPRSFYLSGFTYETYTETNEAVSETMPETILLYDVNEDYLFKVIANLTEEEKLSPEIEYFNFTVERQTTNGWRTIIFYSNIQLFEDTVAILPFSMISTDYTMEIDHNGDGITDETTSPDFVYVDYMPKAEIISPIDNSMYLFGEEIIFNGIGTDFEDGILTDESLVWFSDFDGIIGMGNEFSTANLSVGRHNITLRVNDSLDQINTSTVSIFVRSTQPDMFIDILKSDETPQTEQHTTVIETLADQLCNLTVYIRNTGYGTLHNVQILTNVTNTKDMGDINEGEEKLVSVQFTPTIPGLFELNVTVKSDEVERSMTRTLLVEEFDFIVSIPKTEYNQNEPVPINISVTNEVPGLRFIDLKLRINITGSYYQTVDIPLLSLAPLETKNTMFTWDTTGVSCGNYKIVSSLIMADREVMSDARIISLGVTNLPPVADANGPYTGVVGSPITFNGTGSYDPDGTILSYEWDLDDDGEFDDATGATPTKTWAAPYTGDISLRVTDNKGATDIDSTTLTVEEVITAKIDFDPDTLNKKSQGRWVTVYIELPVGFNVTNIDVSTIMLDETVPAELKPTGVGDYDSDGISDLMMKFDRQEVVDILPIGDAVSIKVTGKLTNGTPFEGSDVIRVIKEGKGK